MTPQNKKVAMYLGGAVVVGAVGFFVYSFFQKPITVGSTTVTVNPNDEHVATSEDKPKVAQTYSNPFTELLNKGLAPLNLKTYSKPLIGTDWTKGIVSNNTLKSDSVLV